MTPDIAFKLADFMKQMGTLVQTLSAQAEMLVVTLEPLLTIPDCPPDLRAKAQAVIDDARAAQKHAVAVRNNWSASGN